VGETPRLTAPFTCRRSLHLLQGRPARRMLPPSCCFTGSHLPRACLRPLFAPALRPLSSLVAPRLSRLRPQRLGPIPKKFAYTFDHLAEVMNRFTEGPRPYAAIPLHGRITAAPSAFRMIPRSFPTRCRSSHRPRDAVAHSEGTRCKLENPAVISGADRAAYERRAAHQSPLAGNKRRRGHAGGGSQRWSAMIRIFTPMNFYFLNQARPRPTFQSGPSSTTTAPNVEELPPNWQAWD